MIYYLIDNTMRSSMKKKPTAIFLILLIVISFTLISCNDGKAIETDPAVKLTEGIDKFLDNDLIKLESSVSTDGIITDTVSAIIDRNMSQAKISINDTNYYYFGKIRFKGNDSGITIVDYMSFSSLIDLMGATLLNFTFDKGNFSSIKENNGVILAQFVGKGASYSFKTNKEFNAGSLSIFFTDGQITKTVFSSYYTEGAATRSYTAVTTYSPAEKLWDQTPKVIPSPNSKYANFLLTKLELVNPGKTFKLVSTNHDTSAKVSNIVKTESLMSSVFVKSEGSVHTITITYAQNQLILGISGAVKTVDLCFDDDYKVYYMYVNSGNKYILS